MENILLFLLALAIAGYYYSGMRARELAVQAARAHCKSLQLQLLDQSVSLRSTKIAPSKSSLLALQRDYEFEFTATGDERYCGKLSMLNQSPQSIWLQAHRLPTTPTNEDTL